MIHTIDNIDIVYKAIAGSRAYGLNIETSDTDIRGIFLMPNEYLLGFGYKEQVSDEKNDILYYELNRFVDLLIGNNPNIIEVLFTPTESLLHLDPRIIPLVFSRDKFLTRQIRNTFGGYAIGQIKKARGLNKKIVNPVDKDKKDPLDFCYVFEKEDGYTMLAKQWLKKHGYKQEYCGLSEMPNGQQLYKVFYDHLAEMKSSNPRYATIDAYGYRGIIGEDSNELRHSEIPKYQKPEAFLWYNKDGYSVHCKEHQEYLAWVKKRNPHRYADNANHGKGFDGKNMMHCLRMLDMAIEILNGEGVNLVRSNREWLLSVRRGEVEYDYIMGFIDDKIAELDEAHKNSKLPDSVDKEMAHKIILDIRQ